jgi:ketosteroid isomerase-like protein
MTDEDAVLEANARFYDAFLKRDADAMDALWARTLPVACIHPGWSALRGRARVLASWRGILGNPEAPKLRCVGPSVHLLGESAFVICYEEIDGGRLLATNVFAREDGEWKMVHHQAGPTSRGEAESEPGPPIDLEKLN